MTKILPGIRLGVLDVAPVWPDVTHRDAVWEIIEAAPVLEELGYSRYWLAEHHDEDAAHSAPELLLPVIAGMTERMRVGVAGILLNLHSPIKVAKDFRLLEAVFTGRVDLGIARAGTKNDQALLLRDGAPLEGDHEARVSLLLSYLRGTSLDIVNPRFVWPPNVWMLGTGSVSARIAAANGLRFCFATQIKGHSLAPNSIIPGYHNEFRSSIDTVDPECTISIAGICSDTDEHAKLLLEPTSFVPTIVGGPETCAEKFRQLQRETGVSEFIWLDLCRRYQDRLVSYRLLAKALHLSNSSLEEAQRPMVNGS